MDASTRVIARRFNYQEIQSGSVRTLAAFVLAIGYVWLISDIASVDSFVPLASWIGSLVLISASATGLALGRRMPQVAGAIFVIGVAISVACTIPMLGAERSGYLFLLPILFASVLMGKQFLAAMSGGAVVGLVAVETNLFRIPAGSELIYPLSIIALVSVASYLSAKGLNTALDWVWHAYSQAQESEALARQRRAELRRALDALERASDRLDRSNRELLQARRDADEARTQQEQFVANVSHELRTPLNLVVGFAEMLYLSPESYEGVTWTPDLMEDLAAMYRAGTQLQNLINDVLDLSRIDASRLPIYREQADIGAIISEALETMAPLYTQRGLGCHARVENDLPSLNVDRTRIRQVLLNLLNNALRYTDLGEVTITAVSGDQSVVVSVRDTGVGIPADQIDQIFDKFRQVDASLRRRGGAGLGLAISRQFVELHGGTMWVESQLGQGSTFSFSLPLPGVLSRTTGFLRTQDQRSARVAEAPLIVVDPDPTISQMLSRYLDDRRILPLDTAELLDPSVDDQHPLAVIMNLSPDAPRDSWYGSAGPTTERYSVPILRCSIPSPSWLASSSGIAECLTKPISQDDLSRAIRKHISEPCRILVVDDDPGFVSLIGRMLRNGGLASEILAAYSGADALRIAAESSPDLLLLDLIMPDIDGFGVLDKLREESLLDDGVVIAITGTSYAEEILRRNEGLFTVSQAGGLPAGQLTKLINAVLQVVRPDYTAEASSSSSV